MFSVAPIGAAAGRSTSQVQRNGQRRSKRNFLLKRNTIFRIIILLVRKFVLSLYCSNKTSDYENEFN